MQLGRQDGHRAKGGGLFRRHVVVRTRATSGYLGRRKEISYGLCGVAWGESEGGLPWNNSYWYVLAVACLLACTPAAVDSSLCDNVGIEDRRRRERLYPILGCMSAKFSKPRIRRGGSRPVRASSSGSVQKPEVVLRITNLHATSQHPLSSLRDCRASSSEVSVATSTLDWPRQGPQRPSWALACF